MWGRFRLLCIPHRPARSSLLPLPEPAACPCRLPPAQVSELSATQRQLEQHVERLFASPAWRASPRQCELADRLKARCVLVAVVWSLKFCAAGGAAGFVQLQLKRVPRLARVAVAVVLW